MEARERRRRASLREGPLRLALVACIVCSVIACKRDPERIRAAPEAKDAAAEASVDKRPFEVLRVPGAPRSLAIIPSGVLVLTDAGLFKVDPRTRTSKPIADVRSNVLAANAHEAFLAVGNELVAIDLDSAAQRLVATATLPITRIACTADLVAWVVPGAMRIADTKGVLVEVSPWVGVRDVKSAGDRLYWAQVDESIWTLRPSEKPKRVIHGYDARGPFAVTRKGLYWPNQHDRTAVRFEAQDEWPHWLGYSERFTNIAAAAADDEFLYLLGASQVLMVGHAHWSEPTVVAENVEAIAADSAGAYWISKSGDTTSLTRALR